MTAYALQANASIQDLRRHTGIQDWEIVDTMHFTRLRGVRDAVPAFVWFDRRGISARCGPPFITPIHGPRGEPIVDGDGVDPLLAALRAAGLLVEVSS